MIDGKSVDEKGISEVNITYTRVVGLQNILKQEITVYEVVSHVIARRGIGYQKRYVRRYMKK